MNDQEKQKQQEQEKEQNKKQAFSTAWKKAADLGKKAAEGTKKLVDQTKENIHEQKAKKYTEVTKKEYSNKSFVLPSIILIEDDSANREFIDSADAIGWIEIHKDTPVLHMYSTFIKKCRLTFIPTPQKESVYCQDIFENDKYIDSNQVFKKSADEKLAELEHIAYSLGAKSCSVEIVEAEKEQKSVKAKAKVNGTEVMSSESSKEKSQYQKGKTKTKFEGHDNPQTPKLKWFAHDDNIKGLIEMRLNKAIKSKSLELNGATSATMSKKTACAIDDILKISGSLSLEKKAVEEYSNKLLFEIEF